MGKPASVLGHWRTEERERRIKAAEYAKPRGYFRASELGAECRRKVMLDTLGFRKRGHTPETELMFRAGDVYHALLQNMWQQTYQIDGIEAIYGDDLILWNHLKERASVLGATMELKEYKIPDQVDPITGEPLIVRALEYVLPCTDDEGTLPVTVRVRSDGVIMGDAGADGYWEPDDWFLWEIKSTREANIKRRRQDCAMQPSHILQVQISQHLMGLQQGLITVVGRDGCTLLGDEFQKAYKNKSKPWSEHPEYQWPAIEYDATLAKAIQRRLCIWERERLRLQPIAEKYGLDSPELLEALPTFGCTGPGDWKYNYCDHNRKVSGAMGQSQACCPGGC